MRLSLLSWSCLAVLGCGGENEDSRDLVASAALEPRSGVTSLAGEALFLETADGEITLHVTVQDAPPGLHGVHIHEHGDCSAPDASSAGGHWNPLGAPHGAPGEHSHLGDLGNLTVEASGLGKLRVAREGWRVADGSAQDVLGKALVIHELPDDLMSQPAGNSGSRIACGVIE